MKSQNQQKHQEQKLKSVYLKTALASILDKLGAIKIVPEDQMRLMLGDDVLIDSLAAKDRNIFNTFTKNPQTADKVIQSESNY